MVKRFSKKYGNKGRALTTWFLCYIYMLTMLIGITMVYFRGDKSITPFGDQETGLSFWGLSAQFCGQWGLQHSISPIIVIVCREFIP